MTIRAHRRLYSLLLLLGLLLFAGTETAFAVGGASTNAGYTPDVSAADAEIRKGNFNSAISMLTSILESEPENADALNLMGYSLRKAGLEDRSESFYLRALAIDPEHRGANEYLGELYVATGKLDKARQQLTILARLCGNLTCAEYQELAEAIAKI